MIYLYDTGRGVIGTNEAGAKQIEGAITKSIEELLIVLHNEPEEEVINEKWIDYGTYQFEKLYKWQKIMVYETEGSSL